MMRLLASRLTKIRCVQLLDRRILVGFPDRVVFVSVIEDLGAQTADIDAVAYVARLLRLAAAVIAGYGLFCFIQKDIVSYMLLKNQFVFFDFEQSAISVFAEYIAMMGFWIFVSFYIVRGIGRISGKHSKDRMP